MTLSFCLTLLFTVALSPGVFGAAEVAPGLKTESFDHDPNWEGFNNHVVPKKLPTVIQNFGYSTSNIAGKAKGEIGGQIWRSSTRASYAASIPAKTLGEKLSASGTFALTSTSGSSGAFFGWFNAERTGGVRRSSLGFRFAGEGSGARLTLQLVTDKNQACGTKVTPWIVDKAKARGEGRKFRPTSIKNDGTRYAWTLNYDPNANGGDGQIQCTVRGNAASPEEFESKTFTVPLPKGYKEHGTTFDRFGLMNSERGGNPLTIHFDDLQFDGKSEDFSVDPEWIGSGNHASFKDPNQGGAHDFGFLAQTSHTGGSPGELGGTIWRSGAYAYYADRVGLLTLTNRLEARGKVLLEAAPPDSGMYFGWFNSAEKEDAPAQAGNFVGVKIGGPTRVGHYFVPCYATMSRARPEPVAARQHPKRVSVERSEGPILVPQKVFEWKVVYDPAGNGGAGTLEATLGSESVILPLKKGDKEKGGSFDRFGLFTTRIGGSYVRIYFDDLAYTSGRVGR
ncbi:MAG: hypothetical protein JWM68_5290 [Verrucomicrobiales bacterium]|nr:hypothetical protein [Verrucomicrobiales bacterium]